MISTLALQSAVDCPYGHERSNIKSYCSRTLCGTFDYQRTYKKANLNERTLIRLLQNERNINVIQLAQLAEVFGVYPHELIEAAERFIERAERGPVSLSVEPDSDDATARDRSSPRRKHSTPSTISTNK